jgi:DNA primase
MTLIELTHQVGINPKWVSYTGGGEFHSSCPACGGSDRFYIQPNRQMSKCLGYYRCRKCGISGDSIQFAKEFLNYSFLEAVSAVDAILPEVGISKSKSQSYIFEPVELQYQSLLWIEKATKFVIDNHERLIGQDEVMSYLSTRGLPLDAIRRYKFGWLDKPQFLSRTDWGLEEQMGRNGKPRPLWIPSGLIIPIMGYNNNVIRLKVRRFDWHEGDKLPRYVSISGSMNGLSLIGNPQQPTLIIVESELDAYALAYAARFFVCVVAVGSNIKNTDTLVDSLAKKANHLLICHDNDDAGEKMFEKWKKLYRRSRAFPTPIGKDVGEALQNGFNIREWILQETVNQ